MNEIPPALRRISQFVRRANEIDELISLTDRDFTPIMVTGPPGVGKTTLVRFFLAEYLPPRMEVEWVDLERTPDPIQAVELTVQRLRQLETRNRLVVVLDGVEGLLPKQLEKTFSQLYNWKVVKNVIAISRNRIKVRRAKEIYLAPTGKLYGLREQTPERRVIKLVAPQIITTNDELIMKLKRAPGDVFKITPRQFEEVIADLLTDMGMDVELTPATRDGGKDILAYMKTEIGKFLCLVEAKQYDKRRPVGVGLVRSLFGTLVDHQATSGMLVTTSRFAGPAKEFQERHKYQLSLKDYGDVVSWILQYKGS